MTPFGNEFGTVTFAEFLEGDLRVQGSVFIGPTGRIVFRWTPAGPEDVRIMDDH